MKSFFTVLMMLITASYVTAQTSNAPLLTLDQYVLGSSVNSIKLIGGDDMISAAVSKGKQFVQLNGRLLSLTNTAKRQLQRGKEIQFMVDAKAMVGNFSKNFTIVPDNFHRNKVIAHRGAWKHTGAPQNSIASLTHAISLGCEGSEFDVHLTADYILVLNHDAHYQGMKIEESSYDQLKQKKLPNGEDIPLLRDFLKKGMQQMKTKLILEIKPSSISKERGRVVAEKVVRLVHELGAQGWVDYISFDYDILKTVLEFDPTARVAFLNGDVAPAKLKDDGFYGFDYHFTVLQKNPEWIKDAKANDLTINAWTVNAEPIMDWLLQQGADFITTDEPEILLKKVNVANVK